MRAREIAKIGDGTTVYVIYILNELWVCRVWEKAKRKKKTKNTKEGIEAKKKKYLIMLK